MWPSLRRGCVLRWLSKKEKSDTATLAAKWPPSEYTLNPDPHTTAVRAADMARSALLACRIRPQSIFMFSHPAPQPVYLQSRLESILAYGVSGSESIVQYFLFHGTALPTLRIASIKSRDSTLLLHRRRAHVYVQKDGAHRDGAERASAQRRRSAGVECRFGSIRKAQQEPAGMREWSPLRHPLSAELLGFGDLGRRHIFFGAVSTFLR